MSVAPWQTLQAALEPGWSAPEGQLRVARLEHGIVFLSGRLDFDDSVPGSTIHAFTLPLGYRPSTRQMFASVAPTNNGACTVITPNGEVRCGVQPDGDAEFDPDGTTVTGLYFLGSVTYPVD